MGTRLIAGRDLTDVEQHRNVASFGELCPGTLAFTAERSASESARVKENGEIIGVVGDVRHDGADQKAPADHLLAGSDE
jgi:hypothetical protein